MVDQNIVPDDRTPQRRLRARDALPPVQLYRPAKLYGRFLAFAAMAANPEFDAVRHSERQKWLGKQIRHALIEAGREEPWLAPEIGVSARTLNDRINAAARGGRLPVARLHPAEEAGHRGE